MSKPSNIELRELAEYLGYILFHTRPETPTERTTVPATGSAVVLIKPPQPGDVMIVWLIVAEMNTAAADSTIGLYSSNGTDKLLIDEVKGSGLLRFVWKGPVAVHSDLWLELNFINADSTDHTGYLHAYCTVCRRVV